MISPKVADHLLSASVCFAALDNRLTLGASADYKLLCEPSQSGALPVCLHWQKYTVFVSSAVQAIGVKAVSLCAPLQNG